VVLTVCSLTVTDARRLPDKPLRVHDVAQSAASTHCCTSCAILTYAPCQYLVPTPNVCAKQTPGHGPSSSDTLSVQLLELEPAAIMLCTLEPDDFGEHDMKTVAGRQVSGSVAT